MMASTSNKWKSSFFCCMLCLFSSCTVRTCSAVDTISATESISHGQTIISAGGSFELGFFGLANSKYYLGIWFKKISVGTVVWVANRETPLANSSGVLEFDSRGALVLRNQDNLVIWSSNIVRALQNPVAELLDTGNLVIREENDQDPENYSWESFHYPDQTFLAGMKIGRLANGLDVRLSSWTSEDNPSRGNFTILLDSSGWQVKTDWNSATYVRSGPWNGITFSGMPFIKPNPVVNYIFVHQKDIYYTFELVNSSVYSRSVVTENGDLKRYTWIDRTSEWSLYASSPADHCDMYALCGAYGSCDISSSPACACLNKFVPKYKNEWNRADWSGGCIRRIQLDCAKGDGFRKYQHVKLPDLLNYSINGSMTLEKCKLKCLQNCTCMAYANSNITEGGSGCFHWFGDLIDIKQYKEGGQDLYIRVAASEADDESGGRLKRKKALISTVLVVGLLLLTLSLIFLIRRKKKQNEYGKREDIELPHFDFSRLAKATNNFSSDNMIGEGGFGPVYKGQLEGLEFAVKRLSKDSSQGLDEFKNEVKYIAKLQHRNLVKLLGYCIHLDDKMLIYEYMANKSLDYYIFDERQSVLLNWTARLQIINGISRGLLYLHQDSRLRIIHRDLKLSNILLDNEMNSKISDFGMARSFGGNESEGNTRRVVGTYGYMSPEYAIDGLFSVKSDIFSFGVLLLEIISGKRNRKFSHPDHDLNLLGHAWKLFKEGRYSDLIDKSLFESCNLSEVSRTIHVGLLCVQHNPEDRPDMSSVVLMLSGAGALPEPKEPGFFTGRKLTESNESLSINEVTISVIDVR